jgi:hypothetical protein
MERTEADHAKADQVRMARNVATMFDELKAMVDRHAELHADLALTAVGWAKGSVTGPGRGGPSHSARALDSI